jgi:hypothetical protein
LSSGDAPCHDIKLYTESYPFKLRHPQAVTYYQVSSRVEAGSNTSTVALRDVGGDEKGTQCLGTYLGHPVPGGYKYGDLVLQVGGVSKLIQ